MLLQQGYFFLFYDAITDQKATIFSTKVSIQVLANLYNFKHPISEALTAVALLVHHVVPPLFLTLSISARWDTWQSVLSVLGAIVGSILFQQAGWKFSPVMGDYTSLR
jgi:hypothetical protein